MTDPGPHPDSAAPLEFGPAPAWAWAFAGVAVVAAGTAVFADAEGRVLAVAVAVAFAALALVDRRASPRLEIDAAGIVVRSAGGARRLAWDDVETVRVDERIRFGRVLQALEVDAGEQLAVFGRRSLGSDPVTAARRIVGAAPPALRAGLGGDVRRHGRR